MPIRIRLRRNGTMTYESDSSAEFQEAESTRLIIETSMEYGRSQEHLRVVAVVTKLGDDYPELRAAGDLILGLLRRPL